MSRQEYNEFHESYSELHEHETECPECFDWVPDRVIESYHGRPMCDRCREAAEFYEDEIMDKQ